MAAQDNIVIRSAPSSYGAPSHPFIHVPAVQRSASQRNGSLDLSPSCEYAQWSDLTSMDMAIITRNKTQKPVDRASEWSYEQRRQAQSILDFLYLGPTSVIRDHKFLVKEGITKLLVLRDARLAGQKMASVENARAALGIDCAYVDVEGSHHFVALFPRAIREINNHMLDVYYSQSQGNASPECDESRRGEPFHGKVLVACDSGNDRSAAVVAAYIMCMFQKNMIVALQFIGLQRFCCGLEEDLKLALLSWDDLVRARSSVAQHNTQTRGAVAVAVDSSRERERASWRSDSKRRHHEVLAGEVVDEEAEDERATTIQGVLDQEQFQGRMKFTPFIDVVDMDSPMADDLA